MVMGQVHKLITQHGRDLARAHIHPEDRYLIDVAAEVMTATPEDFGWAYTGWAFAALPHKQITDVNGRKASWQRDIGPVTLTVNPGKLPGQTQRELIEVGVPFGAHARLVMLYLQTQALKTSHREIEVGKSLNAFLGRVGVSGGGKTRQSVWDQLLRIAACEIIFTWQQQPQSPPEFIRTNVVQAGQLGIRMTEEDRQGTLWSDKVTLSHEFFESLQRSAVPLLEQAIKAIGASSLALDLYVWLAYRLRKLERPTTVSWFALHQQFGAEYRRPRDFRRKVQQPLKLALAAYPEAQVTIEEHGVILYPSQPPIYLKC